jgi:SAM-dependent methyltransferase
MTLLDLSRGFLRDSLEILHGTSPAIPAPSMDGLAARHSDLIRDLARRTATDAQFDTLYSEAVQAVSGRFWTPLAVATRAADLFEAHTTRRVLDVGSGPGKFCLAAAAAAPSIAFTGIEQRPQLVEAARRAAGQLGLPNAHFEQGDVTTSKWGDFDGFYFYNPFGENINGEVYHFDESVELSQRRFIAEILAVERLLLTARVGTTVITYYGFGGRIPLCYELSMEEECGGNVLRGWQKRAAGHESEGCWLELAQGGVVQTSFFPLREDDDGRLFEAVRTSTGLKGPS